MISAASLSWFPLLPCHDFRCFRVMISSASLSWFPLLPCHDFRVMISAASLSWFPLLPCHDFNMPDLFTFVFATSSYSVLFAFDLANAVSLVGHRNKIGQVCCGIYCRRAGDNIIMSTFTARIVAGRHTLSPVTIYAGFYGTDCRSSSHIVTLLCHLSFTSYILLHHTIYTSLSMSCQHFSKHWTRQKRISSLGLHLICSSFYTI